MAGIDPEKVVSGRTLCEGRAFADAGGLTELAVKLAEAMDKVAAG